MKALLSRFPTLEVLIRLLYWRVGVFRSLGKRIRKIRPSKEIDAPLDFSSVISSLRAAGVQSGDILIVHSSYRALQRSGLRPDQVIEELRNLVGPTGTLAMPAIPIVHGDPQGADKFSDAAYDRLFNFDPHSTRIWTGALPKALMQMPSAVRSLHPGNSMVAIGTEAGLMMQDNLAEGEPRPCGKGSSWHYAYTRNAKVAAIGVDMVHSLTMIHVAEDAFDWPIAGWYRRRRFLVRGHGEITIRERKHSWSQFYAERAFDRDLRKAGVLRTADIDGLPVSYCESAKLISFLRSHPREGYPYRFPFGLRLG